MLKGANVSHFIHGEILCGARWSRPSSRVRREESVIGPAVLKRFG